MEQLCVSGISEVVRMWGTLGKGIASSRMGNMKYSQQKERPEVEKEGRRIGARRERVCQKESLNEGE